MNYFFMKKIKMEKETSRKFDLVLESTELINDDQERKRVLEELAEIEFNLDDKKVSNIIDKIRIRLGEIGIITCFLL